MSSAGLLSGCTRRSRSMLLTAKGYWASMAFVKPAFTAPARFIFIGVAIIPRFLFSSFGDPSNDDD